MSISAVGAQQAGFAQAATQAAKAPDGDGDHGIEPANSNSSSSTTSTSAASSQTASPLSQLAQGKPLYL
ncbi:MAG: hypothetical protein HKL82_04035 [Acidimicrobiaceae bacterium]|nr:hypothetical protein [Acidimicrobiaceae bacterium]